jgi:glycosyltransferase involved in cell wall biosynthesis
VLALCRPFFPHLILHWHGVGLGEWLDHGAHPVERWITRRLLGRPDLSIVLGEGNRSDAEAFESRRTVVIPNGIPDPCPNCEQDVLPQREARARARASASPTPDGEPQWFTAVFIGLCIRSKGIFDAVDAVALANARLEAEGRPIRVRFRLAGAFLSEAERVEFDRRIERPDLAVDGRPVVRYVGFVSGEEKRRFLAAADVLLFPTYYEAESQGLVVIEALAYDLPVVVTRWRAVPEAFPDGYPYVVEPRAPVEIARALVGLIDDPHIDGFRERFLERYTVARFVADVRRAVLDVQPGR